MAKVTILLLLIAAGPLLAAAQSIPQSASDKLPTVTVQGNTNPETVSDINAQLIWLLAAAPAPHDSAMETAARAEYWRVALGNLNGQSQEKLSTTLRDFRSRHDAFAAEYNTLIPSVSRDDIWKEYRDFRIKVNDLVAETIRNLNDSFPDSAAQFHSTIEECKRGVALSAYRSSADPDYASSSRAAATGFTYIQGAVSSAASQTTDVRSGRSGTYITAVIVGMVPGCPGKVSPQVALGGSDASVDGPQIHPREYMNFQQTGRVTQQSGYLIVVGCELPGSH